VTKVAWHLKKDEIQNSHPNETKAQFIYHMSKSEYRKDWGKIYEKPGVVARAKALFLKIMPKVGPFSDLAFHPPTPAVEQLYTHSVNLTLEHYRTLLHAQQEGKLEPMKTSIPDQSQQPPVTDCLTTPTRSWLRKRAANPSRRLWVATSSHITPISRSRSQPRGTRRLGASSSTN